MPDLISIVFPLTARADTDFPVDGGGVLQGAFLTWLQQVQPELAAKLHDGNKMRPYTLSPLMGVERRIDWRYFLRKGESAWFRLTGLDAGFNDCVLQTIMQLGRGPAPEDSSLEVGSPCLDLESHPWAAAVDVEPLLENLLQNAHSGALPPDATLNFETPTCFMEHGQSLPLPVPRYVFANLANKWRDATGLPLPVEDGDYFLDNLHIAFAQLTTRTVTVKKYRRTGFTGKVKFAVPPKMPHVYRAALHLLAGFAFFAGVGSHTTAGMGQTYAQKR